jgi:hypothetical protein
MTDRAVFPACSKSAIGRWMWAALAGLVCAVAPVETVSAQGSSYASNVLSLNPVAYWRLNDQTNPNPGPAYAADASTNGLTGEYGVGTFDQGTPGLDIFGPTPPNFPGFETNNGALETFLNKQYAFVTVPALNLNTNTVTIYMWVFPTVYAGGDDDEHQNPGTGLFFWRGNDTAGFNYNTVFVNDGLAYTWGSGSAPYSWQSGIVTPFNLWSMVTLVVTPTNATIYMANTNGFVFASTNIANGIEAFDGVSAIGTDPYSDARTFNGFIDEVAVFNQALSESQVAQLYTAASGVGFAPIITSQPVSETLYAGKTAQYSVAVSGAAPFGYFGYQWYTTNGAGDFVALTDGENIAGSMTSNLAISDVSTSTPAEYEVVVSNGLGTVTSSVVTLTIAGTPSTPYAAAVAADAPIAYWRLNDSVSPNPGPAYAAEYDGFIGLYGVNTSNYANGILGPIPPAFPGFETNNGAVETFNGVTNSYITVPALNLNTNVVTISMWIYPIGNQPENTALFLWRGSDSAGFVYNGQSPDNSLAYNWGSSFFPYIWESGIVPPTNLWSFVSLVVTPTNATIYMMNSNGLNYSTMANANPVMPFNSPSAIGSDTFSASRTFNGCIDEVAIYNQALSQTQIGALYTAGTSGGVAPPPAPTLQISLMSPTNVLLSWPATASNFGLQGNAQLGTTNWCFLTNSVVTNGGQIQVALPIGPCGQFYRLSTH